jgi:hypothetical protein
MSKGFHRVIRRAASLSVTGRLPPSATSHCGLPNVGEYEDRLPDQPVAAPCRGCWPPITKGSNPRPAWKPATHCRGRRGGEGARSANVAWHPSPLRAVTCNVTSSARRGLTRGHCHKAHKRPPRPTQVPRHAGRRRPPHGLLPADEVRGRGGRYRPVIACS